MNDLDGSKLSLGQSIFAIMAIVVAVIIVGVAGYEIFIRTNDNEIQPPPMTEIRYWNLPFYENDKPIELDSKISKKSWNLGFVGTTVTSNQVIQNDSLAFTKADPKWYSSLQEGPLYITLPTSMSCVEIDTDVHKFKCMPKEPEPKELWIGLDVEP